MVLFVSSISGDKEFAPLLEILENRLENHALYEIQPLSHEELYTMQKSYLKAFKRTLTAEQDGFFKKLLLNEEFESRTVFRNKLFLSVAKGLTSYNIIPKIQPSTEGALNVICEKLYSTHGKLLTQMILGLISIPSQGFDCFNQL
jgi:hypothetical protein